MDSSPHNSLDSLLALGAQELDLTPSQHKRAVGHYEAVGEYLSESGSPLESYSPLIFAQGSMAIGTATKPVASDEFDLDLMCQMLIRADINPDYVKKIIGDRLKDHGTYKKMLVEKNRCWRLVYAGEFYMDIIPGVPDIDGLRATSLLVPDKELRCWKETDPKGYAEWFLACAAIGLQGKDGVRAEVEPAPAAPNIRRKLPLQVVVQLLKRHRDLMFMDDEDAPISIIITTLAARAYEGSQSITTALSQLLRRMPKEISRTNTGVAVVENPINPRENFADKWKKHPRREKCFYEWIARAQHDAERLEAALLADMQQPLSNWVGTRAANSAISNYGENIQRQRANGLKVAASTGAVASQTAGAVHSPNHTFFGS